MEVPERHRPRRDRAWNGEEIQAAFAVATSTLPWTVGYRSFNQDWVASDAQVRGHLPSALRGVFYRNGPARHERGGQRYGHRWDGDGMVHQFRFTDQGVSHLGRFVQTRKYVSETEGNRFLVNGFGTTVPESPTGEEGIEAANPANISVLRFGGELLALWEAGPAYRLDPSTLMTEGVKVWSSATAGKPFSAHPRVGPDQSLWNFGIDPVSDELHIYHAANDGKLLHSHVMSVPQIPPTHDFAITENYLVFLLPSMTLNKDRFQAGTSFGEACQWSPSLPMRALIIDKRDWSTKFCDLPPGVLFHIANAWEDKSGVVRLEYMRASDPTSLLAGWSVMRGEYKHCQGSRLTSAALHPTTGAASQTPVGTEEGEFPIVDPADVGRRHKRVLCVERGAERDPALPGFDSVTLVDVESGGASSFVYGNDWLVEEHVFANCRGEKRARWIIGSAIDLRENRTVVSVFDGSALADGPVAQANLSYTLPLGLHGSFDCDPPTRGLGI